MVELMATHLIKESLSLKDKQVLELQLKATLASRL